jgi:pyruvate ferredoxin oxidoreductase beta subunit
MTVGNRAIGPPINIWNDWSDSMAARDAAWIQLFVEDNQQAADVHVQAFRLAEAVSLPVMVCMDGFILTHAYTRVDVPEQGQVDRFLPAFEPRQLLDPAAPITMGAMVGPEAFAEVRFLAHYKQLEALDLIPRHAAEFETIFGRDSGGLLKSFDAADKDTVVVSMGSVIGTLKSVLADMRQDGSSIGLLSIRSYRPFPKQQLSDALAKAKRVIVFEKCLAVGMGGILAADVRMALANLSIPIYSVIGGLGGRPITQEAPHAGQGRPGPAGRASFSRSECRGRASRTRAFARHPASGFQRGKYFTRHSRRRRSRKGFPMTQLPESEQRVKFYQTGTFTVGNRLLDEAQRSVQASVERANSLDSGHRACQGCGEALGARYVVDAALRAADDQLIAANATGCLEVFTTPYPESAWRLPWIHSLFGNAPAVGAGIAAALRARGREDVRVIAQGGDGGTTDIGMGCLSGVFERDDDVLYVCYNNQAYMNTGVQRSSQTPPAARTATTTIAGSAPGNGLNSGKSVPLIAMAHGIPYVATASVDDLHDLESKVVKAMGFRGARYLEVFVPCPLGWGSRPADTIKVARLATQSGMFPLIEAEYGELTAVTPIRDRRPVEDYLKLQRRFAHVFAPENVHQLEALREIAERNIRRFNLLPDEEASS